MFTVTYRNDAQYLGLGRPLLEKVIQGLPNAIIVMLPKPSGKISAVIQTWLNTS